MSHHQISLFFLFPFFSLLALPPLPPALRAEQLYCRGEHEAASQAFTELCHRAPPSERPFYHLRIAAIELARGNWSRVKDRLIDFADEPCTLDQLIESQDLLSQALLFEGNWLEALNRLVGLKQLVSKEKWPRTLRARFSSLHLTWQEILEQEFSPTASPEERLKQIERLSILLFDSHSLLLSPEAEKAIRWKLVKHSLAFHAYREAAKWLQPLLTLDSSLESQTLMGCIAFELGDWQSAYAYLNQRISNKGTLAPWIREMHLLAQAMQNKEPQLRSLLAHYLQEEQTGANKSKQWVIQAWIECLCADMDAAEAALVAAKMRPDEDLRLNAEITLLEACIALTRGDGASQIPRCQTMIHALPQDHPLQLALMHALSELFHSLAQREAGSPCSEPLRLRAHHLAQEVSTRLQQGAAAGPLQRFIAIWPGSRELLSSRLAHSPRSEAKEERKA